MNYISIKLFQKNFVADLDVVSKNPFEVFSTVGKNTSFNMHLSTKYCVIGPQSRLSL